MDNVDAALQSQAMNHARFGRFEDARRCAGQIKSSLLALRTIRQVTEARRMYSTLRQSALAERVDAVLEANALIMGQV